MLLCAAIMNLNEELCSVLAFHSNVLLIDSQCYLEGTLKKNNLVLPKYITTKKKHQHLQILYAVLAWESI